MAIAQVDAAPIDECDKDVRSDLQRIAGGDDQGRGLAFFDGAERFTETEDLGRPNRHSPQRRTSGQTESNGRRSVLAQAALVSRRRP